jgi:hypothetical protein
MEMRIMFHEKREIAGYISEELVFVLGPPGIAIFIPMCESPSAEKVCCFSWKGVESGVEEYSRVRKPLFK